MPYDPTSIPLLDAKHHDAPSVFKPESLLREARRQKRLPQIPVPEICILDPDGDLVRNLRGEGRASPRPGWACYHSELDQFDHAGIRFGVIGCAVGASFAVLLAEELFASGCRLLLSITSAGEILASGPTPYFVVIDRALRDEGTSYHYLPPARFVDADRGLTDLAYAALVGGRIAAHRGATWTTDAPFRETEFAIEAARENGILAVEMEAAALYAFARARGAQVLCLAFVTNQMAQSEGDFEKGESNGAAAVLAAIAVIARAWRAAHP